MLTYRTKRKPEMIGAHVATPVGTDGFTRKKAVDAFQTHTVYEAANEFLRVRNPSPTLRVSRLTRGRISQ